jgi:hypothetical protein
VSVVTEYQSTSPAAEMVPDTAVSKPIAVAAAATPVKSTKNMGTATSAVDGPRRKYFICFLLTPEGTAIPERN